MSHTIKVVMSEIEEGFSCLLPIYSEECGTPVWREVFANTALVLEVSVSGIEGIHILETNALLRGECGWAAVSASTGERWHRKPELNGQTAWESRGGCPGAWRIFPLLMREVCLIHQPFQVARIPPGRVITSLRWITFLLARPFFLQMDLPIGLSFSFSRFSFPPVSAGRLHVHYVEDSYIFTLMRHISKTVSMPVTDFSSSLSFFIKCEQTFEFSKDAMSSMLCFNVVVQFQLKTHLLGFNSFHFSREY